MYVSCPKVEELGMWFIEFQFTPGVNSDTFFLERLSQINLMI